MGNCYQVVINLPGKLISYTSKLEVLITKIPGDCTPFSLLVNLCTTVQADSETQLAEGRAEVWCNEGKEALSRVKDAKDRMYNAVVEASTDVATRSVYDKDYNAAKVAENAVVAASDLMNKAKASLEATKGHVSDALYFALEANDALNKANVALAIATRAGYCWAAAAA